MLNKYSNDSTLKGVKQIDRFINSLIPFDPNLLHIDINKVKQ